MIKMHLSSIREIKFISFIAVLLLMISARPNEVSLELAGGIPSTELVEILGQSSMQVTGNCFADESAEPALGDYDDSTDNEHYSEYGQTRQASE